MDPDPLLSRATGYTTLAAGTEAVAELEIKRSRFLAVLRRAGTEAEARALVEELRRSFHDARHHCSAFVLGPDRDVQRSSDDGEPAGTAGLPMLEALVLRRTGTAAGGADVTDLSDVSAVVVRWFGGTLLGAGGLVRAYSDAVSQALDGAQLVRRRRQRLYRLPASHADAGRIENELRATGLTVLGTSYGAAGAELGLALPDDDAALAAAHSRVAALTGGAGVLHPDGVDWVDSPDAPPA
ncbi:YigZ family protein [Kocuria sp. SM24M-10]|uniref:IMPACT family protein n=1 Tax=Kocuria sp. SM24M-10 TaxID=1660349 RepID=UPI00064A4D17|nr:YigZ family protein [Kocuria sp. SM24M-10]KLU09259.1 Xaa-Pro dipeptidase [Kocuria sp. SM24M-10]